MTGVVRVTVDLTPEAYDARNDASARCGDTHTDTMNRALVVYNAVLAMAENGSGTVGFEHRGRQVRIGLRS